MEAVTAWLGIVVQVVLAGAAIWYTFETRALRVQSQRQMDLLRTQGRLAVAPLLIPGVFDAGLKNLQKKIEEDKAITDDERRDKLSRLAAVAEKSSTFVCGVMNPTAKVPQHCSLWIYDARTKSFLMSDTSVEVIGEKDTEIFSVSGPHFSAREVLGQIRERYGDASQFADTHLIVDDESYILLFFRDMEGRVYLCKRGFSIDEDGSFSHKPSRLYVLGGDG